IFDVRSLFEKIVDLPLVHPRLLFIVGLATDPPSRSILIVGLFFKDIVGDVITMSKFLCFPFTANVKVTKENVIP
nr:hypothetical protein [Tanacetum cinerariifolium]